MESNCLSNSGSFTSPVTEIHSTNAIQYTHSNSQLKVHWFIVNQALFILPRSRKPGRRSFLPKYQTSQYRIPK